MHVSENVVEHALGVSQLIDAELRVGIHVVLIGDGCARLEVDNHDTAVGVDLDSVDRAAHIGAIDFESEPLFGAHKCLAVALKVGKVLGDAESELPHGHSLRFGKPGRFKQQLIPAFVDASPH